MRQRNGINIPLENELGHKDLYPLYYGYENCLPGKSFGPAVREKYLIHYIVSGSGVFYRGGTAYPASLAINTGLEFINLFDMIEK